MHYVNPMMLKYLLNRYMTFARDQLDLSSLVGPFNVQRLAHLQMYRAYKYHYE